MMTLSFFFWWNGLKLRPQGDDIVSDSGRFIHSWEVLWLMPVVQPF
jgi:hypothetical protein